MVKRKQVTLLVSILGLLSALALSGGPLSGVARAADPDIRSIRPTVMLLVDSSLSMEYLPSYVPSGASRGCATAGACPVCTGGAGDQRNRWTTTLEALTGTFSPFTCTRQGDATGYRTTAMFAGQYDYRAQVPYHQPNGVQLQDGILDGYVDRVKFGLMTFDGAGVLVPTAVPYLGADVTVASYTAAIARANTADGMYSYGRNVPYSFPGCVTYLMNNGARSKDTLAGGLVSVGNDTADFRGINAQIQTRLLATRPYGGTPIAGMLDDAKYWLQTDPDVADPRSVAGGDPFYQCRSRYLLLLTDGYPDSDKRTGTVNCEQAGGVCPYARAEELADELCQVSASTGKCAGASRLVDGIFVVGLSVSDAEHVAQLNLIAQHGGTDDPRRFISDPAHPGLPRENAAFFASNKEELLEALATALDQAATGVTTRTVPAFAASSGSGTQMEFSTGFSVGTATAPWSGVLDRRRYICNPSTLQPEIQSLAAQDRFHTLLDSNTSRNLLTVVPTAAADVSGYLIGVSAGYTTASTSPIAPAQRGLALTAFATSNSALTAAHFGSAITPARRTQIIDWVHGAGRPKLGDIYHSSPVVVGPIRQDLADESYNLFRQDPLVANRPTVVYVGSNDGVLHAFVAEDFTVPATHPTYGGRTLTAGTELWGFVPPAVLPLLNSATSAHAPLVDGTPVVKEVFLRRLPGQAASGSIYRTVMVVPLRGIGTYVALDITDPLTPGFLWQFTQPDMGPSYGRPGIGQVLVTTAGGSLEERAVAILPGGVGAEDAALRAANPTGCTASGIGKPPTTTNGQSARSRQRCWGTRGRSLTWIDFATGDTLTRLTGTTFDAPLSGGVSLFPGDVGTVATRAFVTDQDGVVWRVDLSQPTIASWKAESFYDLFIGGTADTGQPAFDAPIVSTDLAGYPVILQASGDIDALDGTAANRIASITEKTTCVGATCSWTSTLNWEARLAAGEQVTGPLQLFDGKVYFATFSATSDPTDACAIGSSRLWGVEYLASTTIVGQTTPYPAAGIEYPVASGVYVQQLPDISNAIIMGVGVTQRPTCFSGLTETDAYSGGTRYRHAAVGGGEFQLVAQVSAGGGAGASLGTVTTITRTLTPPAALTSIQAWNGSID